MCRLLLLLFVTLVSGTDTIEFLRELLNKDLYKLLQNAEDPNNARETFDGLGKLLIGYQLLNKQDAYDSSQYASLFANVPGFGNFSPYVDSLKDAYTLGLNASKDYLKAVKELEEAYCTDPVILEKQIIPSVIAGPLLVISMTTGSCALNSEFDIDGDLGDLQQILKLANVSCVGPEVQYVTTPITFASKYIAPETYIGQECKRYSVFGDSYAKELYSMGEVVTFPDVKTFLTSISTAQYPFVDKFGNFTKSGKTFNLEDNPYFTLPLQDRPIFSNLMTGVLDDFPFMSTWASVQDPNFAKLWKFGRKN
eukprot:TRINITY_DN1190_c0_g1_i2.p1 TRINITY_DN1190_c0_g1~~TRINITY_DN1190_c0_g1_i2.p1  ORF type:complete len:309 (-),score=26.84 TRINITY_DN1190_c0_g1_i2:154-1080(-)